MFNKYWLKAFLIISILIPSIFLTAYYSSNLFHERVNLAIDNIATFSEMPGYVDENGNYSSVGVRLAMTMNSWQIIKKNKIIGVGTGDFPVEYKKINELYPTSQPPTTNPHNMYVLILVQIGLVGLISMLSIFYYQIKQSFISSNRFIRDAGITLPILFLVVMWSDSYILGHFTTLMFVFFSLIF